MSAPHHPIEPILDPSSERDVLFPVQYPEMFDQYKKQLSNFWTAPEVDMKDDRYQFMNLLNDGERRLVQSIIVFFASADSVVSKNLMNRFCKEVTILEAQISYTFQAMMENIHAEVYSLTLDAYIPDIKQRDEILNETLPNARAKIEWAKKWGDGGDAPFAARLLAYIIVEGVLFQGSFCAIYWFKERNLLPALTKSNEFIARDEGMHCEFGCLLYDLLQYTRLPECDAHAMLQEAVEIEIGFITEAMPENPGAGMNATMMIEYIKSVADAVITRVGYAPVYGATNPFRFMECIGMQARSNFFEERVSQYQRADVYDKGAGDDDNGYKTADF